MSIHSEDKEREKELLEENWVITEQGRLPRRSNDLLAITDNSGVIASAATP